MNNDRGLRLTLAICVVAWLVLTAPWLFSELTIPYDAKAHFQPQLHFLANALHTGQSPFWNPHTFGGSPQIADPQSLIFSPALLLAVLTPTPGLGLLDAYTLALLGFAALAIVMFFRERGWHPAGAIVAALAFAFGASAAWRIQHIGQIQSLALFAIALWLLHRALVHKTVPSALLAGLACGALLVEPNQVALLAAYVLSAYALAYIFRRGEPRAALLCYALTVSIAAATALVISALPMVWLALFAADTSRPDIPLAEAARGSLDPASMLTLVVGDLFGAGLDTIDYWGPHSEAWNPDNLTLSQNMSQLYLGSLPAMALIVFGLAQGALWNREIRIVTAAMLVMIVYALGTHTPLFGALYHIVPGVSFFRRPADATFMVGGLGAIVAGYCVHVFVTQLREAGLNRGKWMIGAGLFAAVFLISIAVAVREGAVAKAAGPLMLSVGLLVASAAALWVIRRYRLQQPWYCVPLLATLMVADLALTNGPNESTALPAAQYDVLRHDIDNETIRLLKSRLVQPPGSSRRDRVELAGIGFDWPNAGMVHGFDHTLGYNPLRLAAATTALGAGDTIAGWDQRRFTPLFPSYRSKLADMMGLRFLVSAVPAIKLDPRLKPGDLSFIARTSDGYVYENPNALPRVMFVPGWKKADFAALLKDGWPAFDPRRTLLLEAAPPDVRSQPVQTELPQATVHLVRYANTRVDIEVTAGTPGFIVVNDIWHPWWRATVTGQPAAILKANVMFRAVQVPAGRHTVRFTFKPLSGALAEVFGR